MELLKSFRFFSSMENQYNYQMSASAIGMMKLYNEFVIFALIYFISNDHSIIAHRLIKMAILNNWLHQYFIVLVNVNVNGNVNAVVCVCVRYVASVTKMCQLNYDQSKASNRISVPFDSLTDPIWLDIDEHNGFLIKTCRLAY